MIALPMVDSELLRLDDGLELDDLLLRSELLPSEQSSDCDQKSTAKPAIAWAPLLPLARPLVMASSFRKMTASEAFAAQTVYLCP
jgi:hypothetical protein